MVKYFDSILKDKYLRTVFGLSFAVLLFGLIFSIWKLWGINAPIIIHFDVYKNADFFGTKIEAFGVLFSAIVMVLINSFLSDFLYDRERFLSYILSFGSLVLSILILIAVSVIVSVN